MTEQERAIALNRLLSTIEEEERKAAGSGNFCYASLPDENGRVEWPSDYAILYKEKGYYIGLVRKYGDGWYTDLSRLFYYEDNNECSKKAKELNHERLNLSNEQAVEITLGSFGRRRPTRQAAKTKS